MVRSIAGFSTSLLTVTIIVSIAIVAVSSIRDSLMFLHYEICITVRYLELLTCLLNDCIKIIGYSLVTVHKHDPISKIIRAHANHNGTICILPTCNYSYRSKNRKSQPEIAFRFMYIPSLTPPLCTLNILRWTSTQSLRSPRNLA